MALSFDQTTTIMRFITKTTVSSGAAAIISNAVKATTPADINRLKKITIWAGTAAISGLVAEHATQRIMKTFDGTVTAIKDALVDDDNDDDPDVVSGEVIN